MSVLDIYDWLSNNTYRHTVTLEDIIDSHQDIRIHGINGRISRELFYFLDMDTYKIEFRGREIHLTLLGGRRKDIISLLDIGTCIYVTMVDPKGQFMIKRLKTSSPVIEVTIVEMYNVDTSEVEEIRKSLLTSPMNILSDESIPF